MAKMIGDGTVLDPGFAEDPRDQEIEDLRRENRRLQRSLGDAQVEVERAREDATRALSNLRRQLSPLYRALQMVFGELESAGVEDTPSPSPASAPVGDRQSGMDPKIVQVWDEWKQKLGPGSATARVIDALMVHKSLNVAQLKVAAKMATQTVYDATSKLNRLGLINKTGGQYSLKSLA